MGFNNALQRFLSDLQTLHLPQHHNTQANKEGGMVVMKSPQQHHAFKMILTSPTAVTVALRTWKQQAI